MQLHYNSSIFHVITPQNLSNGRTLITVADFQTKEFRCPPREQMNTILGFKNLEAEDLEDHPCIPKLRDKMAGFHDQVSQKHSSYGQTKEINIYYTVTPFGSAKSQPMFHVTKNTVNFCTICTWILAHTRILDCFLENEFRNALKEALNCVVEVSEP